MGPRDLGCSILPGARPSGSLWLVYHKPFLEEGGICFLLIPQVWVCVCLRPGPPGKSTCVSHLLERVSPENRLSSIFRTTRFPPSTESPRSLSQETHSALAQVACGPAPAPGHRAEDEAPELGLCRPTGRAALQDTEQGQQGKRYRVETCPGVCLKVEMWESGAG